MGRCCIIAQASTVHVSDAVIVPPCALVAWVELSFNSLPTGIVQRILSIVFLYERKSLMEIGVATDFRGVLFNQFYIERYLMSLFTVCPIYILSSFNERLYRLCDHFLNWANFRSVLFQLIRMIEYADE